MSLFLKRCDETNIARKSVRAIFFTFAPCALADHALICGVRPHLYVGAMGDKDLAGVARELKRMEPLSVTFVQGDAARYAKAQELWEAWGIEAPMLTVRAASAHLRAQAEAPRLVTGSLYLLGDLLRELGIQPF